MVALLYSSIVFTMLPKSVKATYTPKELEVMLQSHAVLENCPYKAINAVVRDLVAEAGYTKSEKVWQEIDYLDELMNTRLEKLQEIWLLIGSNHFTEILCPKDVKPNTFYYWARKSLGPAPVKNRHRRIGKLSKQDILDYCLQ